MPAVRMAAPKSALLGYPAVVLLVALLAAALGTYRSNFALKQYQRTVYEKITNLPAPVAPGMLVKNRTLDLNTTAASSWLPIITFNGLIEAIPQEGFSLGSPFTNDYDEIYAVIGVRTPKGVEVFTYPQGGKAYYSFDFDDPRIPDDQILTGGVHDFVKIRIYVVEHDSGNVQQITQELTQRFVDPQQWYRVLWDDTPGAVYFPNYDPSIFNGRRGLMDVPASASNDDFYELGVLNLFRKDFETVMVGSTLVLGADSQLYWQKEMLLDVYQTDDGGDLGKFQAIFTLWSDISTPTPTKP